MAAQLVCGPLRTYWVEGMICSLHHFMAKVLLILGLTLRVTVIKNTVKIFRAE